MMRQAGHFKTMVTLSSSLKCDALEDG